MVAKKTGKAAKSKRPATKRKAAPKRKTKKAKSPNRRRTTRKRPAPKLATPALSDYAEKTGACDSLADPEGNPPAGTVTIHYTDAEGDQHVGRVHHDGEGGVTVGDSSPSDMRDLDIQRDPDDDSSTNDNGVYHDEEEGA